MKKILLLPFVILFFTQSLSATSWYTNLESAQKVAIASNKLIVIDFWATWCGPCKKMDREVWNTAEVQEKMKSFVPLKLDLDTQRSLAIKYDVKAIPYIFIIDGNGEIVYKSLGYMDKEDTLELLNDYSLDTNFLQAESIQFYKYPNYVTALRLSQKYLDFSLFVDPKINKQILELSEVYLKQANKLIDKNQSNFEMVDQKISLMEANIDLYKGDFKKVDRFLSRKIEDDELMKRNWGMYSFLNYCLASRMNKKDSQIKWKEELKRVNRGELYLARSEKFLAYYNRLN